jgi:hypothetical protein
MSSKPKRLVDFTPGFERNNLSLVFTAGQRLAVSFLLDRSINTALPEAASGSQGSDMRPPLPLIGTQVLRC